MKPLFKNITKYNKKNYEQFLEFHNKKYSFSYNFYTITMIILLIYCIIFNIIQKNFSMFLLFLVLLIIFLFTRIYLPIKRYQKTQKQIAKNKENNFTFSFYDLYFTINKTTFYYLKLYKVFETNDYFYLYINEDYAALVSKNGFKVGTAEEFSKFIKKKCLFKYSRKV